MRQPAGRGPARKSRRPADEGHERWEGSTRDGRGVRQRDRNSVTEDDSTTQSEVLKGRHPVASALDAGRPVNKVLIAEGTESGLQHIVAKARERGIVVQFVPRNRLDAIVDGVHQGVVAYVAPYDYVDIEDILIRETDQSPLIVVLDGVTDPHNLGAIIRTAEAAGAKGVVIGKHRAAPVTETVAKAAAGALEYMPVARVSNIAQTLKRLKDEGYWVVGAAPDASERLTDVDYKGKTVVVIGSEGQGLHRLVEECCDFLVAIPILGRVQSLNASVAAGVMLYEVVRQRT